MTSAKPPGGVLFRVLGPLEVWTGLEWAPVSAAKPRTLLALLLLHPGEVIATYRLIDEIWGEHPPAQAPKLVSGYMYKLRRLLRDSCGRILVTRSAGYQLAVAPDAVDAGHFAGLAASGRAALSAGDLAAAADLLAEAFTLWRGQAFTGVATPLVNQETRHLDDQRTEALALRAKADVGLGRYTQAVPGLRQANRRASPQRGTVGAAAAGSCRSRPPS
jgi:DNA-binding SARP family transcriptional activator